MVEKTRVSEEKSDAVLVGCFDDPFVSYASSRLGYVFHSALGSPVDIVSEREEGVGSKGHSFVFL